MTIACLVFKYFKEKASIVIQINFKLRQRKKYLSLCIGNFVQN